MNDDELVEHAFELFDTYMQARIALDKATDEWLAVFDQIMDRKLFGRLKKALDEQH